MREAAARREAAGREEAAGRHACLRRVQPLATRLGLDVPRDDFTDLTEGHRLLDLCPCAQRVYDLADPRRATPRVADDKDVARRGDEASLHRGRCRDEKIAQREQLTGKLMLAGCLSISASRLSSTSCLSLTEAVENLREAAYDKAQRCHHGRRRQSRPDSHQHEAAAQRKQKEEWRGHARGTERTTGEAPAGKEFYSELTADCP